MYICIMARRSTISWQSRVNAPALPSYIELYYVLCHKSMCIFNFSLSVFMLNGKRFIFIGVVDSKWRAMSWHVAWVLVCLIFALPQALSWSMVVEINKFSLADDGRTFSISKQKNVQSNLTECCLCAIESEYKNLWILFFFFSFKSL